MFVSDLQRHSPGDRGSSNVSTYAFFPLVGGVAFELLGGKELLHANPPVYILLVFALFLAMNVVNFLLVAVGLRARRRRPDRDAVRTLYGPVVPVEFATGLLTAGVAFAYQGKNLSAVALLAVIGLVFQYLLRTALNSDGAQGPARGTDTGAGLAAGRAPRRPSCRPSRSATR